MTKSKYDPIPDEFKSIEEAATFWDTHSLADYEDLQQNTDFKVHLKSEKNYFAIDRELSDNIDNIAHIKGILPETLVNLWIQEKIIENQNALTHC